MAGSLKRPPHPSEVLFDVVSIVTDRERRVERFVITA